MHAMPARLRTFLTRHPIVRDALLWAIPALVLGGVLRLLLLSYLPYAYWGSDSRSYFSFAHKLLTEAYISLDAKRRFFYPILMVPLSALPGAPLSWVAWAQHALGLATLVPLAYLVRKSFFAWRWWIVPITVLYAGMPILLWYEHELLGETVFFAMLLCAFAGWVAWVSETRLERSLRLFWLFFVPFALFILTKPSGRFAWPGVLCGLVLVACWRRLDWRRFAALGALMVATLAVGSGKQGAWLLYTATFPLTQIETPLHAEYKAEIRDKVEAHRLGIDQYYREDDWPFAFLEAPGRQSDYPQWQPLGKDDKLRKRIYMDLALEGVRADPGMFLYLGWQRFVGSLNPSEFKEVRFTPGFYVERFEHFHAQMQEKPGGPIRFAFALPPTGALPPYSEFQRRLSPAPDGFAARAVNAWVAAYFHAADFVQMPVRTIDPHSRSILRARIKPLGWWLIAGALLSLLPPYTRRLGVWTLVAASYLAGVFLFSQVNPRYLAPSWPVLIPLLAVPADMLARLLCWKSKRP